MLKVFIQSIYAFTGAVLFIYGLNSLILCLIFIRNRKKIKLPHRYPDPLEWPLVTIQLPIFNESSQVEALLHSVTSMDYPHDCMQIQVLDDSTDRTTGVLQDLVRRYHEIGFNIQYSHRFQRDGYKAENLNSGLQTAEGEFIAIFDADFRPIPQFLKTIIKEFTNSDIAFVQGFWRHSNLLRNLVTAMGGIYFDGHLVIEQNARSQAGLYMNFTGSGGVWRKKALESIGGWQADTVTEDMDASFRVQLAGWKGKYYPFSLGTSELPERIDAYKLQQYRWARGGAQNFKKHIKDLIIAKQPIFRKFMGILHLLSYVTMPLLPILLLVILPILLFAQTIFYQLWWYVLGGFGPFFTFGLAQVESGSDFKKRLPWIPFVAIAAIGVSVTALWGSLTGLLTKGGEFVRTQRASENDDAHLSDKGKRLLAGLALNEFLIGVYLIYTLCVIWQPFGKYLSFWLGTSTLGFWLLSFYTLFQDGVSKSDKK